VARTTITLGGDLRVGRIGYGAMRLTGLNLWGEYADRDGGIALRQAAEAGVTLIDTADVYPAVTAHFKVVAREQAAVLEAALEAGAAFVPWQPVSLTAPGSPTDTGGPAAVRSVLEPVASRHRATISRITLAWLAARSPAIMPCPGTTSTAHRRDNLDAEDIELSREDTDSIDSISRNLRPPSPRRPAAA
jgi:aryl-alcohol dehydrogenase-like predicted oxidoreductase